MKNKNILITGGYGFIGTNLIKSLKENGFSQITVLDDLSVGKPEYLTDLTQGDTTGITFVKGDISNKNDVEKAFSSNVDAVVHLAAQTGVIPSIKDPYHDLSTNVIGTVNLLEASRRHGISKFIFISSNAPVGEQVPPINEMKLPKPMSPYGASKLSGEAYCSAYYHSYGFKSVILRNSNVYGPGSRHKGSVVSMFINNIFNNMPLMIFGDGNQTRDFIHTEDLCKAILLTLQNDTVEFDIFQIATGTETTVNFVAEHLKKLAQELMDKKVSIEYAPARKGEIIRNYSNIAKAKKYLKFNPGVDIENGLNKTIKWFSNKQDTAS